MNAKAVFESNLRRSLRLVIVHDQLLVGGKPKNLATDVLRMSLVMTMASLDAYLHQIIGDNLVPFTKKNLKLISKDPKRRAVLSKLEKFVKETISPFEFLEIMGRIVLMLSSAQKWRQSCLEVLFSLLTELKTRLSFLE